MAKVLRDEYYHRLAKLDKYRARSAYKLIEIDKKYKLLKKGQIIVDLGSAPGSWSQVALEKLNGTGYVLAVDVLFTPHIPGNFEFLRADFTQPYILEVVESRLPEGADIVMCDAAPEFSGAKEHDLGNLNKLNTAALRIALDVLKEKGVFLCKSFQSKYLVEFTAKVKKHFTIVKQHKPRASQRKSAEIYIVAMNKH